MSDSHHKAGISSGYRWRLLLVGLMCSLFGLWFLYDGAVGYPQRNERVKLFQANLDNPRQWEHIAVEHGWPLDNPGAPKSSVDMLTQYILGFICLPIGLFFSVNWLRMGGRWIASDGRTLSTSWGRQVPFAAIQSVDSTRWKTKGIAVVHYDDGQGGGTGSGTGGGTGGGGAKKLVLDDWKYDRAATANIYAQVAAHLGGEQPGAGANTEAPSSDEAPSGPA